jgi:hypothetical protein
LRIRYEEKTYESYFNAELATRGIFYFPLGQVQEGHMGGDAAVFTNEKWLWRLLGFVYGKKSPFAGVDFKAIAHLLEAALQVEIKNVPSIKVNLLLQFKRSEYMVSKLAAEWPHWKSPYYRYNICPEQQATLARIHASLGIRVLVAYAAPTIKDVHELVALHVQQKVIASTNFRPAHQLNGHDRNTFASAGTHSIACSQPERLEPFGLLRHLQETSFDARSAVESVTELASRVTGILAEGNLAEPMRNLQKSFGVTEIAASAPLLASYLNMLIFKQLTGVQWIAVTGASTPSRL